LREKDFSTLEFKKFLENLSEFSPNEITKKEILNLKPTKDEFSLKNKIKEAQEFIDIANYEGYFPLTEYPDITESLNLLKIEESILSAVEIRNIATIFSISREIKNFLSPHIRNTEILIRRYKSLYPSRETERIVNDSIDSSGSIKDSASRDLTRIRKDIKEIERKVVSILENMVHKHAYSDIIQDKIVTIRKNRFVIPVKQNFSSKIKGIIHDRSSSGHTIYLEPENVVELNNKLSDLKIKEKLEIRRILKFLTNILRDKYNQIYSNFQNIVYFDLLYAKYKFSKKFGAVFPQISEEIYLKDAKHPLFLFAEKEFKPLDIIIEKDKKGLVITGPNTGGKTVTLKTLGILSLIFQTGIPIPVSDESKIPIFDGIFADIGDMQSIEQDLSTYSAHIQNIKEIIEKVDDKSLVLLDELIPGTDPDEGSAIGIGILKKLKEKNSFILITSHFKQIKMFALSDSYFEVASVGFDKKTLSPTYKIYYKTVGQSMAFYIAEKLGFDRNILEEAKQYLDESSLKMEEVIESLENYKSAYEKEHQQLLKLKREVEENKRRYEKLLKELEIKKREKWVKELKEVENYVNNIREEGYRIIQKIKENPSGKDLEKFILEKKQAVSEILEIEKQNDEFEDEINIGDKVKFKGKNTVGEVISVREEKANVSFNGLKMWVKISDLQKVDEEKEEKKFKKKFNVNKTRVRVPSEIKLIGKTREEAIAELNDYLDKAILEGLSTVRIIHGYGSGILRKAIREYLKNVPYKISYEDAPYHEGGMGVTIAHLK
jgi:DNA mismatch repair protein MutS2